MATTKTAPKTDTLIVVPTKIRVSNTVKRTGQPEQAESSEQTTEVHKFATTPTIIKCSIPIKMTMNYQSIGFEFGMERPCYTEEVDAAADEVYAAVFAKIQAKIPEIQALLMEITGNK